MNINQKISLHNRFDIEVRNAKTGELKQQAYAENIVLDTFWGYLCGGSSFDYNSYISMFGAIRFGRGTGTLSAARTTLFSEIADYTAVQDSFTQNKDDMYTKTVKHITILENQHVGETLTEVGIGTIWNLSDNGTFRHLVTHALLKDMNGNSVEILKTDVDIITIYASLYVYYSNLTAFASADDGHVILAYPSGSLLNNAFAQWLGGNWNTMFNGDGRPSPLRFYYGNAPGGRETSVDEAHTNLIGLTKTPDVANKKFTMYYRIPAANANAGSNGTKGIGSVVMYGDGFNDTDDYDICMLFGGATGFPEGVVIGEPLLGGDGIKTRFQTVFNRLKSVTRVYIDAVQTTEFTVPQLVVPYSTRIDELMKIVDSNVKAPGHYFATPTNAIGQWTVFENPLYQTNPLYQIRFMAGILSSSNDMVNWTVLATQTNETTFTIPVGNRGDRYWKLYAQTGGACYIPQWIIQAPTDYMNIQFNTPPGLITGESVGTGDATENEFMLDFKPIAGALVVLLDGVETLAYTLNESLIVFTNPPALGVAITANYRYEPTITIDYKTTCAPKDVNHVLDVTFQLQFGEYIPS